MFYNVQRFRNWKKWKKDKRYISGYKMEMHWLVANWDIQMQN